MSEVPPFNEEDWELECTNTETGRKLYRHISNKYWCMTKQPGEAKDVFQAEFNRLFGDYIKAVSSRS